MNALQIGKITGAHQESHQFYSGRLEKNELSEMLILYEFDLKCLEDVMLDIKRNNDSSIYMIVNLDTKALERLYCQEVSLAIPSYANLMLYLKENETIRFHCEAGKKYNFLLLQIELSHFESNQKLFLDTLRENNVFQDKLNGQRVIVPNLKIYEIAKNLKEINKSKYCNMFIARGFANILIGHKIKEFLKKDVDVLQAINLRQFEIQQLEHITKVIEQHPHRQYNIKDLCKTSGLSVSKLQLGFKQMHNCTVAIFIRNVRLDKALEMLQDSDLNVSEIVYSVGLNSRSYFCRIFKKRFNCSPKTYQQQLKQRQLTAS